MVFFKLSQKHVLSAYSKKMDENPVKKTNKKNNLLFKNRKTKNQGEPSSLCVL